MNMTAKLFRNFSNWIFLVTGKFKWTIDPLNRKKCLHENNSIIYCTQSITLNILQQHSNFQTIIHPTQSMWCLVHIVYTVWSVLVYPRGQKEINQHLEGSRRQTGCLLSLALFNFFLRFLLLHFILMLWALVQCTSKKKQIS